MAGKSRILIPVRDAECVERFASWLESNPQFWNAQVKLVHILRPLWFDDLPYSATQAMRLVDEQAEISAETRREFIAVASTKIERKYSDILVSVHVTDGHLDGETFSALAEDWSADFILVFCRKKGVLEEFLFGHRLASKIISTARCPVYIIKEPRESKSAANPSFAYVFRSRQ